MKIKVTRQDIQCGEAGNSNECAIALALQRHFKTNIAYVNGGFDQDEPILKVDNIDLKVCKQDIDKVGQFIDLFDDYVFNEDVVIDKACIPQPFEFEVDQYGVKNENRS
jgi:hypothetical protein